jgi:hypothetical protein
MHELDISSVGLERNFTLRLTQGEGLFGIFGANTSIYMGSPTTQA